MERCGLGLGPACPQGGRAWPLLWGNRVCSGAEAQGVALGEALRLQILISSSCFFSVRPPLSTG